MGVSGFSLSLFVPLFKYVFSFRFLPRLKACFTWGSLCSFSLQQEICFRVSNTWVNSLHEFQDACVNDPECKTVSICVEWVNVGPRRCLKSCSFHTTLTFCPHLSASLQTLCYRHLSGCGMSLRQYYLCQVSGSPVYSSVEGFPLTHAWNVTDPVLCPVAPSVHSYLMHSLLRPVTLYLDFMCRVVKMLNLLWRKRTFFSRICTSRGHFELNRGDYGWIMNKKIPDMSVH